MTTASPTSLSEADLQKEAGLVGSAVQAARKLLPGAAKATAAATPAASATARGGFGHALGELGKGMRTGRKFGVGPAEAAGAAPSLWRSVGHNMADQAISGAISGSVLGAGLGAYQASPGSRFEGALSGAATGAKGGFTAGVIGGGVGGALRHGRYKALRGAGQTADEARAVMSKTPLQNAQDAWEKRNAPGAWQADAIEAAAVPATILAENAAQGVGEMKNEKRAQLDDIDPVLACLRSAQASRLAKIASYDGTGARPIPHVVVVPMMHKNEQTPEQAAAAKAERDRLETDQAVGRAVGPLAGTIGTEALLRSTLDPAVREAHPGSALQMLHADSVPRKILLPGLGAALGAYGAHRIIQARRAFREQDKRDAQRDASGAAGAVPVPPP